MSRKYLKYFHLFAALAVLGLFTSLVHYHSEGLACLDHADETHYLQNEDYCPICTINVQVDSGLQSTFDGFLSFQELLLAPESQSDHIPLYGSRFGRAPPSLI